MQQKLQAVQQKLQAVEYFEAKNVLKTITIAFPKEAKKVSKEKFKTEGRSRDDIDLTRPVLKIAFRELLHD